MPVFGCHSCGVDIRKYKSYEESPCATCKLKDEYYNTHKASFYDSSGNSDEEEEAIFGYVDANYDDDEVDPIQKAVNKLKAIKEVIEKQVFIAASGLILKMVKLAKENPTMFEAVIKKMQYPYMSYSEIGNSMTVPCSKQNVLYHLKHAVELFPEIATALITDTRFSSGKHALQTIANRRRQDEAKQRLKGLLYGEDNPALQAKSLKEIDDIIRAPFMMSQDVLNFNPYIDDEMIMEIEKDKETENAEAGD